MITTPQQSKSDAEVAKTPDRYLKSKTPQRINHINKWSMEINPRSKEKKRQQKRENEQREVKTSTETKI